MVQRKMINEENINKHGEIDLTPALIQCMNQMCFNPDYSDVNFIVDGVKLPAHKNILATRSTYFRALLFGGLAESTQDEIELKVPLQAFKSTLKYLYTGRMSLAEMRIEEIMDCLNLTDQYGFDELKSAIAIYLSKTLSLENCWTIFEAAQTFHLKVLTDKSMTFIEKNLKDLLISSGFRTLSQDSLCTLLVRDSFFAPELQIFNAVNDWFTENPNADFNKIMSLVRLSLISLDDLLHIQSLGVIDPNVLFEAIKEQRTSDSLRYRGPLLSDVNIATSEYNAKTVKGQSPNVLLDGNTNFTGISGFTFHEIGDGEGIVVELGQSSVINRLRFLLWDGDNREYKYYVEASFDQKKWNRIVDRTKSGNRSWQDCYFHPQVVRFIRLIGTENTSNSVFHVVSLEAYFASKVPKEIS